MPSTKELQKRTEDARNALAKIVGKAPTYQDISAATIGFRQAEIAVTASQLAEISTRRLVKLSWWLVALTGVLLILTFVLAVFTIALYKDAHFQIQREKQQQHTQFQQPQLPPKP